MCIDAGASGRGFASAPIGLAFNRFITHDARPFLHACGNNSGEHAP